MPTTSSATRKQKSLEDYGVGKDPTGEVTASRSQSTSQSGPASKRKLATDPASSTQKRLKSSTSARNTAKQTQPPDVDALDLQNPILINRAPVLQLWAATVAYFLHPDESWDTCLSVGASISTLCAMSKGRAIGKIEPNVPSSTSPDRDKDHDQDASHDSRDLHVMGFPLHIKNDVVVVNGKAKPVKEQLLQRKYGGEEKYNHVRHIMDEALQIWTHDKQALDSKAFHMYERFRPSTPAGSSGWGRNGELNLQQIKSTIESKT